MKIFKLLTFSFLVIVFFACTGKNQAQKPKFSIVIAESKKKIRLNDTIKIDIKNPKALNIDSVSYKMNDRVLESQNNTIILKDVLLGNQELHALIHYNSGKTELAKKKITVLSNIAPKVYTYEIIETYPHDIKAYTQGLEFHNDTLYEGTGRNGQSSLRKIDYRSGNVLKKIDLNTSFFGEGITILNEKIYQLTWQKKTGFVYNLNDLSKIDTFVYGQSKEGWGLCNDGKKLYKSDGTEKIWFLNPDTLVEEGYIQTVTNSSVFSKANELEFANGKIYANSYQKDGVMIIEPDSGAIVGVVDFRGLKNKVTQHDDLDVLNGIAYHPDRQTFFVTGKNWDKLFEIKIIEK